MGRSLIWTPEVAKPRYQARVRLNPSYQLNKGLSALWLLNEGGGSSVRSVAGRVTGTITGAQWNADSGLHFASSQQVDCGEFFDSPENFTILSRVRLHVADDPSAQAICSKMYDGATGAGWAFCYHRWMNKSIGFFTQEAGGSEYNQWSTSPAAGTNLENIDQWYSVAVVWTGGAEGTPAFYIDGTPRVGQDFGSGTVDSFSTVQPFRIGNVGDNLYYFNGDIDYLMVYNRLLTVSEVLEVHLNPWGTLANPRLLASPRRLKFDLTLGGLLERNLDDGGGIWEW